MIENKNLKVINLFAGPCAGKSVIAAELFANMKKANYNVELVHEVAKDFVWDQRPRHHFREQALITAQQDWLFRRLVLSGVEWAVSDTSLLLAMLYKPDYYPLSFETFLLDLYNSYTNINFFVQRSHPYQQLGRNETADEAKEKDWEMMGMLVRWNIPHHIIDSTTGAVDAYRIIQQYQSV